MLFTPKEEECRSLSYRRRNILYLIEKYLMENGFQAAGNLLQKEAKLQTDYEVCDNVDLDTIYLEYLSYCKVKFGKYPQVVKKSNTPIKVSIAPAANKKPPAFKKDKEETHPPADELSDVLKILPMSYSQGDCVHFASVEATILNRIDLMTPEWKEFADSIQSTIVKKSFNLKWDDIAGNAKAVKILRESIEIPFKHPDLFTDALKPWKSLLMHGPPGTGKTLLARIACSESLGNSTFFNIPPSVVTSKWRGDSEKIIRMLFEVAGHYKPSIIFFDEIEGLTSKRDRISDHEASKRFKNEFLQQLDGLEETTGLFVLATSNLPWEIDSAFLRRFERKALVELPNDEERVKIFKKFLGNVLKSDDKQLLEIAKTADGFTGDEIRIVCKELAMKRINALCSNSKSDLSYNDLKQLVSRIEPTGRTQIEKYVEWSKKYEK